MIAFPDLTPEERAFRELQTTRGEARRVKGKTIEWGPWQQWCLDTIRAWAETPEGKAAVEAWEAGEAGKKRTWPGRPKQRRAA